MPNRWMELTRASTIFDGRVAELVKSFGGLYTKSFDDFRYVQNLEPMQQP